MAAFKFPFKNLSAYRLTPEFMAVTSAESLRSAVQAQAYREGENGPEDETPGWAVVREGDQVYSMERQHLLLHKVAKRVLPAGVVRDAVARRAVQIEQQQGYKPGRKQMRDIKEAVIDELSPKAFMQTKETFVWFDLEDGWLFIDATSEAKRDEILGLIGKTFTPFPAVSLHVARSPASAMTGWLSDGEAEEGFTIDQEAELLSTGESAASVRYLRETPQQDDVTRQVGAGKQCVKLALTWQDRISFILAADLTIKKIAPLDVVRESYEGGNGGGANADAMYQSMFALFTGEVRGMMGDVVASLGGYVTE